MKTNYYLLRDAYEEQIIYGIIKTANDTKLIQKAMYELIDEFNEKDCELILDNIDFDIQEYVLNGLREKGFKFEFIKLDEMPSLYY